MGDYAGSYDHTGDEEVKYVVNADLEDSSWMHTTRTADAEALNEGEYYNEEDGINYTSYDSSQQVGTASRYGHRPVRSVSAGRKDVEESGSSENEVKVKPKMKKDRQFQHLHEPPLYAHSDPGYGGSYESTDHPSHSINRVTSWLRDASLGEHDSKTTTPRSPPKRHPPPRCHPPAADNASHHPIDQCDYEATYYNKTPAWDPSGDQYGYSEDHQLAMYKDSSAKTPAWDPSADQYGYSEDHQLAIYSDSSAKTPAWDPSADQYGYSEDHQLAMYSDSSAKSPAWDPSEDQYGYSEDHQLAMYTDSSAKSPAWDPSRDQYGYSEDSSAKWSVYRPEPKRMEKALKLMRIGAMGFANASRTAAVGFGNVSKTAAVGFGNVSKTAAVGLKSKSIEFKNLAVPVLTPILNAVIEESKEQLMGPDQGRGHATPLLERGQGRGRGRGRVLAARPMHPMMRPNMMPVGPVRPLMRPVMRPGMIHRPLMRPGMRPPSSQPMAPRPNVMPPPSGIAPPIARGQGVPMRGQPQPMRGRARPVSTTTPTDF